MEIKSEFENRMKAILGDEYEAFEEAISGERVKALRLNPLKLKKNDTGSWNLDETLENSKDDIRMLLSAHRGDEIAWEPFGMIYGEETPGKHPYHEAGVYYIQEPSAMAPVSFLDTKPGEKILDLCAAPGGKSTQIAARLNGEGILVTNEIDRKRAMILSLNIERMGITNALVTNMSPDKLSQIFEGYFDKIIVDAPCSGEGMFRKNDEAWNQWSPENVRICAKRQKDILDNAVMMLAPGGRLVYSTCTFAPEEDEESVLYLLRKNMLPVKTVAISGMKSADAENMGKLIRLCGQDAEDGNNYVYCGDPSLYESITEEERKAISECSIRLWPHYVTGEGHFLAVFEKPGDITLNKGLHPINGSLDRISDENLKIFMDFAGDTLNDIKIIEGQNNDNDSSKKEGKNSRRRNSKKPAEIQIGDRIAGRPFMFGDQLYLAPAGMPGIDGLSVVRPGLHLGTIKKGRFEPSHSLALVLSPEDVKQSYDISSDSGEVMQYIGGQSLRGQSLENGWVLITTDGFSLGWAKYAAGVLKNHYPKGLRIYL